MLEMITNRCRYTVVLYGEPLAAADEADTGEKATDEPLPAAREKESKGLFTNIVLNTIIVILAAGCLAVAGVRIVKRVRARRNGDDTDFAVEDFSTNEPFGAPGPERSVLEDARQFGQESQQDTFSIDDLFNEEHSCKRQNTDFATKKVLPKIVHTGSKP